ncbi:S-adenosyl-L-methionine-dependent methyltransferase [Saccharata proteae CBS 121410]|uniref:S-adenosyl-L-methionine-dependent methyltransferase n=1 Tax=Saccharata proteae CBS 121410 TaxID=1314787 RepID=A0A9P4I137_9PEZI|nr:S-adenosyl-L-methionine-dependent methyltransferase [Saccharata proteae CBS 121410]
MTLKQHTDAGWTNVAANYSPIARLTTPPIHRLISLIPDLDSPDAYIMDNGCGSGALTLALKSTHPNARILASDFSPGMVAQLQKQIQERGWSKDVETRVLDAQKLTGLKDATFSHVLSTFMVQFTPAPVTVVREMARVLKPGGQLGLGFWYGRLSFIGPWIETVREVTGDQNYEPPPEMDTEICNQEVLEPLLKELGFDELMFEEMTTAWGWETYEDSFHAFFDAGHPASESWQEPFRGTENWGKIREGYEKRYKERQGLGEEATERVMLVTGRKSG